MKKYDSILCIEDTNTNNSNSPNKKKMCPSRLLDAQTKLLAGLKTQCDKIDVLCMKGDFSSYMNM